MANVTDPLISAVSGSDPQNLMEYITRQKIYDSRFWKESCFGLSVEDVLEKAVACLKCIGGLPTPFLALTLKLLQLHPDTDLIVETFVNQDDFKYVRALGCLYVRLTARPVDIYDTLEPLYRDARKLRVYLATTPPEWSMLHMDELVHQLLTETHVLGIALPRLPSRRTLQEAGYLPEGPRPTALKDVLLQYGGGGPMDYLRHKATVEQSPAAMVAWEKRQEAKQEIEEAEQKGAGAFKKQSKEEKTSDRKDKRPKKKKKKERNYDNLFKNKKQSSVVVPVREGTTAASEEGSDEYWNEQRAKLGLKPLQK